MKKIQKHGQMEMIGLAFVVLLMVLGFFLYISLTFGDTNTPRALIEEAHLVGVALETAMLETTVEDCGYPLAIAIERCVTNSHLTCSGAGVCETTFYAIKEMLEKTLGTNDELSTAPARRPHRAYLQRGEDILVKDSGNIVFLFEAYPDLCGENSTILAAPSQPIHTSMGEVSLVIEFCG